MTLDVMDGIYARMDDDTETRKVELVDSLSQTEIQKFFSGKSVLLTGATGFMGKVFVEKIIRVCPGLKALYIVVRQKGTDTLEEKMEKYFQHIIFGRLRNSQPDFARKVVTIKGDLKNERLGMSESDRALLINELDVIVHSGATTKFDEKVSVALKINVLATRDLLDLALECKHVQAFMYVSTAYSHCYRKDIEEKFYDAPADLKIVHDMIEADTMNELGITEDAVKMLLGKWPNVYTFTKSIAEDLVRHYGERANFACGVYRPSIVSAAHSEPLRGWIGNNNGPAYVFLGTGLGLIHTSYYLNTPMDMIPVDFSINALIAATYDLPERWMKEKRPVVYNYGSSTIQPMYLDTAFEYMRDEVERVGSKHVVWYPFQCFCSHKLSFYICHILFHLIPALLADLALLATGRKPRCLSLFWFGTKHLDKIFYFTNGDWRIHVPETMKVNDRLGPEDRKLFQFDMRGFDWATFIGWYVRGTRIYMMKESMDNVPQMRLRFRRLKLLHYGVFIGLGLLLAYHAYRLLSAAMIF
ncbi:fatty acyl-CoA reductase 1-like [Copidosoma floridanum]|uniref:fatty acyl-CoA reductase 1-like n=1 Tax=Copidosoma floridanum TaxID=29053 RepID=UPI0006C9E50C|nr:fatty acyl-CoA reductase 1-like [Copidosoma floridanum]